MLVLGLHFGHDAGVALVKDGKVVMALERERETRVKHCRFLTYREIDSLFAATGVTARDIDFCAVTTTQENPFIFLEPERLSFAYDEDASLFTETSALTSNYYSNLYQDLERQTGEGYLDEWISSLVYKADKSQKHNEDDDVLAARVQGLKSQEIFYSFPSWETVRTLEDIGSIHREAVLQLIEDGEMRSRMHMPVSVNLSGIKVPGAIISHHYAHAGSAYYLSSFEDAVICCYDGGRVKHNGQYTAGFIFYAKGNKINPLAPNLVESGWLYRDTGSRIGLDYYGAPGKLMGLAPYGEPKFFTREYIARAVEFSQPEVPYRRWFEHCLHEAEFSGVDISGIGKKENVTSQVCCDIAASTQLLVEEVLLSLLSVTNKLIEKAGVKTGNLCISGGAALNCPANTRAASEGPFPNVFIPPGCDDSGLAIGSALLAAHNFLDQPFHGVNNPADAVYLGQSWSAAQILESLDEFSELVNFVEVDDPSKHAARALAENKVIGWYTGRAENGPRALGHRSILSNPTVAEIWKRVNNIKTREEWRPFAPSVLKEEAENWFNGAPLPSPFMLFTANVKSSDIPAVTHVDGSARIQTVDHSCGSFYGLIKEFFRLTTVPLVLNTSFNGPGEPIVDAPSHALRLFVNTNLDSLYLERFCITRKPITAKMEI